MMRQVAHPRPLQCRMQYGVFRWHCICALWHRGCEPPRGFQRTAATSAPPREVRCGSVEWADLSRERTINY